VEKLRADGTLPTCAVVISWSAPAPRPKNRDEILMRRFHRLYKNPHPGRLNQRQGATRINARANPNSRFPNLRRLARNPTEIRLMEDIGSGDPSLQDAAISEAVDSIAARNRVVPDEKKSQRAHGSWEAKGWKRSPLYPASILYIPPGVGSGVGRDGVTYTGDDSDWTYVLFDNDIPPRVIKDRNTGRPIVGRASSRRAAIAEANAELATWAQPAILKFLIKMTGRTGTIKDPRTGSTYPNLPTPGESHAYAPYFQLARFAEYDPVIGGFGGQSPVQVREAPGSVAGDVTIHTWAAPSLDDPGQRVFYSQVLVKGDEGETRPYHDVPIRSKSNQLEVELLADRVSERALAESEGLSAAPLPSALAKEVSDDAEEEARFKKWLKRQRKNPGRALTPVFTGTQKAVRNAADFMGSYIAASREYERNPRMRKRMEAGAGRYFAAQSRRKNPVMGPKKSKIQVEAAELDPEGDLMLGQFVVPKNSADAYRMGYNFGVLAGIQRCGPKDVLKRRQFQTKVTNQLVEMVSKNVMQLAKGARGREVVGTTVS
jgi:hypothetical protein